MSKDLFGTQPPRPPGMPPSFLVFPPVQILANTPFVPEHWRSISTSGLATTLRHPQLDDRGKLLDSVDIRIEPFGIENASREDVARILKLEQDSWFHSHGVTQDPTRALERIIGSSRSDPNPIIVLRRAGQIEAAIVMSFVKIDERSDPRILCKYGGIELTHDPRGNVIVDFSVFTNSDQAVRNLKLFDIAAKATVALGQRLGKDHVVAYSRGELLGNHLLFNPKFKAERYQVDPPRSLPDKVLIHVHFSRKYREPTLGSLAEFFGFNIGDEGLNAAREVITRRMGKCPDDQFLREYFNLSAWRNSPIALSSIEGRRALCYYFRDHYCHIGDPFLKSTHQRLGAKFVALIPGSRPNDPSSLFSNVLMCYTIPELPVSINRDTLSLKGHLLMPEVRGEFADGSARIIAAHPGLPAESPVQRAKFERLVRNIRRLIRLAGALE